MNYVLNKTIKMKKRGEPDLYAPGQPCTHKCLRDDCTSYPYKYCWEVKKACQECPKNKAYELLKTGMIVGSSIVEVEVEKMGIKSHEYKDPQRCTSIVGYDANSLYLWCAGQEMPCGKEEYLPLLKNLQQILNSSRDFVKC